MRQHPSTRGWSPWLTGLLLLAGLLVIGLRAEAQPIKVTSAVPDTTEQGAVDLVVTIGGENFGSNSRVNFYVTGTTNPGGIAVKNVRYKDSRTLEATIDVAPDAQTQLKFDIQVKSGSRTGKGTELFKVLVKTTGSDTIPPGTVRDLRGAPIGFNAAVLEWSAPADDGYDVASGPAVAFELRVRKGWSALTPECGPFSEATWGTDPNIRPVDPCRMCTYSYEYHPAGAPGTTETLEEPAMPLAPNTEYWAMVRTVDDAPPAGNWSSMTEDLLYQVSFTTGPFPPQDITTPWNAGIVDVCHGSEDCPSSRYLSRPRFDFDPAGNPSMLYVKDQVPTLATWTGSGWQTETVGAVIDTGNWAFDFAFEPSGVASIASQTSSGLKFYRRGGGTSDPWDAETVTTGGVGSTILRFNPVGPPVGPVPTIAYIVTKGSRSTLRLAERLGGSWRNQDVASNARRTEGLAFDQDGNPAVTFLQEVNGLNRVGFARRVAGTWNVEYPGFGPGPPWDNAMSATTAFDPSRGDFSVACRFENTVNSFHDLLSFCERAEGSWTCGKVDEGYLLNGPGLGIAGDGTVYLSYVILPTLFSAVRRPGETAWTREYADWNAYVSRPDLRLGPDGQPGVAYNGAVDETGIGPYEPVCFARRTPQ